MALPVAGITVPPRRNLPLSWISRLAAG